MAIGSICLLGAAALSKPGRATVDRLYTMLRGADGVSPGAADAEGRAKEKAGWDKPPATSVTSGTITYFDPRGAILKRGRITVYRNYPDSIRVDIEHQGIVQTQAFDGKDTWQARAAALTDGQERDIRALLDVWPEQLFLARGRGRAYREIGRVFQDSRPSRPVRSPDDDKLKEFNQVEIQEQIVTPPDGNKAGKTDRRTITYLIDAKEDRVYSAQWLEADDASKSDQDGTSRYAVRVDFEKWRRVDGLLWPGQISRWDGGQLQWVIEVKDVQVNAALPSRLFEKQ